ncbi:MAG: hypothetical protein U9P79_06085 [Candidatus Cloacimonadota bacterium]|nr:hypothetical protein [Candidatus Cloacimonadota bacterium]
MIMNKKYGIVHAYAQCDDCDWDATMDITAKNRMQKLRNKIYSHIRKTGHSVTLETGNVTKYYKKIIE